MNDVNQALRGLCMATDNFRYVSTNIIFPENKRMKILVDHAEQLQKAAEKFIKEAQQYGEGIRL